MQNWTYRSESRLSNESVIFDIDGVLADASKRQHFLKRSNPDWESFFELCHEDPLIEESALLLQIIDPKYTVILMTGRPLNVQAKTISWLESFSLRWDILIMRPLGEYSAAMHFKRRDTLLLREKGFEINLAFDDDPRNIEMFRSLKIPSVYLHSGYY